MGRLDARHCMDAQRNLFPSIEIEVLGTSIGELDMFGSPSPNDVAPVHRSQACILETGGPCS